MTLSVNRERFLEEGYLVLREVIPRDELVDLRAAYERLLEQQKVIWAQQRKPGEPPGGYWEMSALPRLKLGHNPLADLIDVRTSGTVRIWLHENIRGVSSELLGVDDAAVTEMFLLCNPVRDRGPAAWHRDLHPMDTAPLQGYIDDIVETGPRYVQWNICLYDDDVLWVVPGSHRRLNTEDENRRLLQDPHRPLPGGVQTHLSAGDGVVYITPILHWGSHYGTRKRRTIHGGFSTHAQHANLSFTRHLPASAAAVFNRWTDRSKQMQDDTESALRAAIDADPAKYEASLERLHPGRGNKGKMLTTVYLCKAALFIRLSKNPDVEGVPDGIRQAATAHSITLNWDPSFADRFSPLEAESLWDRFKPLDALLQADSEQFVPGFQSGPMQYFFNQMPDNFGFGDFLASLE